MENITAPPVAATAAPKIVYPYEISYAILDEKYPLTKANPQPLKSFGGIVPAAPMISLRRSDEFANTYNLFVIAYIPSGATNVKIQADISQIQKITTEAGTMQARLIILSYDSPAGDPVDPQYDQWQYYAQYTVREELAEALYLLYSIDDPRTSRGTVTVVQLT